jgi:hypothetical protein
VKQPGFSSQSLSRLAPLSLSRAAIQNPKALSDSNARNQNEAFNRRQQSSIKLEFTVK